MRMRRLRNSLELPALPVVWALCTARAWRSNAVSPGPCSIHEPAVSDEDFEVALAQLRPQHHLPSRLARRPVRRCRRADQIGCRGPTTTGPARRPRAHRARDQPRANHDALGS